MKLLYCWQCHDVFKLSHESRRCKCGDVTGAYEPDLLHAWYKGKCAVPLGFNNRSLIDSIKKQPENGMGARFEAFVIPRTCDTFINESAEQDKANILVDGLLNKARTNTWRNIREVFYTKTLELPRFTDEEEALLKEPLDE